MRVDAENKIRELKKLKNAIILAHYYAPAEVQRIADYVGDSFYLAKIAKSSTADVIVFCGVAFMGESAKILNPNKKVLMPDVSADCPMAHMVTEARIKELREKYDDLAVVCYINSTAELKCQSDVCVTSSNAVKIVKALPNKNIFFIPDKILEDTLPNKFPKRTLYSITGIVPFTLKYLWKKFYRKRNCIRQRLFFRILNVKKTYSIFPIISVVRQKLLILQSNPRKMSLLFARKTV